MVVIFISAVGMLMVIQAVMVETFIFMEALNLMVLMGM
jgi:hypothetical protein